jgi:ribonuclease P protein component
MASPLQPSTRTLGKAERLTHRKPIESLFKNGRSIKVTSMVLLSEPTVFPDDHPIKMMFIVSKKNYKLAHDRNQIKRWMRESYRLQKQPIIATAKALGQQFNGGLMFTGKKMPNFPYVFNKTQELLKLWEQELKKES